MAEGAIPTRGNQLIETKIIKDSRVRFKTIAEGNFNVEVQQYKVNTSLENLKDVSYTNYSKLVPLVAMTLIHPVVRKLFTEETPNVPLAGRLSPFVNQWRKITRNQEIFSIMKGYQNTIHKSPSSGETYKHDKNVKTTISASGPGNTKVFGEGSYPEIKDSSRGLSEQPFSCGKEGWGKPSGDKSEKTQYIHSLRALQNGRFALFEISSRTKRFPLQDRSQRHLLRNSSQQTIINICEIHVVRQPRRVSLSSDWFRANPKSFYQITKNPNCSFGTNKHSENCLSGRYVTDGADLTENYDSEGYIDFSVAKFGVCHKSEKVNSTTSETIGISEVTDKYRGDDTVSLRRETDYYNSTMSGLFSTKNFSFKFDKVKWPTFVNGPSYIARKNSPTGANTKIRGTHSSEL